MGTVQTRGPPRDGQKYCGIVAFNTPVARMVGLKVTLLSVMEGIKPDTCNGVGACQPNHATDGTSCGDETHIAGSFDLLKAPNAGGFFVGDYEALGVSGAAFVPFFVQAEPSATTPPPPPATTPPTDVFTNSITP